MLHLSTFVLSRDSVADPLLLVGMFVPVLVVHGVSVPVIVVHRNWRLFA